VFDQTLKSYLEHICGAENVAVDVPLAGKTTLGVGGAAKFFVTATHKGALVRILNALEYIEYPYKIIGGGSNLLVEDGGFDGVVIKLGFCEIVENGTFIYADAGANLSAVAATARDMELTGLEFAFGIPGTVGGAVYGNVGAAGGAMADVVVIVDILEGGEIRSIDAADCAFSYRKSVFKRSRSVILGAYFHLERGNRADIDAKMKSIVAARRNSQPVGRTAGCIFKNPTKIPAGETAPLSAGALIDRCGLKGFRIGGAVVSQVHANFIVNDGGATARDIKELIRVVRSRVREKFGVVLREEIEKM
jgi:UDP-N-acetylmuramate dehydrogenase